MLCMQPLYVLVYVKAVLECFTGNRDTLTLLSIPHFTLQQESSSLTHPCYTSTEACVIQTACHKLHVSMYILHILYSICMCTRTSSHCQDSKEILYANSMVTLTCLQCRGEREFTYSTKVTYHNRYVVG